MPWVVDQEHGVIVIAKANGRNDLINTQTIIATIIIITISITHDVTHGMATKRWSVHPMYAELIPAIG